MQQSLGDKNMIISDFLNNILKKQPAAADFLAQISQHVTANITWYKTGHLCFVIKLEGLPFDGVDDKVIYQHFVSLRNVFASIGKTLGDRLAIWCTIQRRKINFDRDYHFNNQFCQNFSEQYLQRFNTADYFENVFHIAVVIKNTDMDAGIKEAQDLAQTLIYALQSYEPTLLTAYQNENGILFSEIYEFFGSLVNGSKEKIPLSATDAFQTIQSSDLHFGTDICEIRMQNGQRKYAQMFDLKDFGLSKPKILADILTLPFEFNYVQSFIYINSHKMQGDIRKQINNLVSVQEQSADEIEELRIGQGKLVSGELMFGDYHAVLIVFGKSAKDVTNNGSRAYSTFLNAGGFRFIKAGLSAPSTYFSQIPGSKERPRSFPKTTINLATTYGLHNYSHGKKYGNPLGDGSAIMPLETVSKTIFDFNFHFSRDGEDNTGEKIAGHTLILGATGTGKTTTQCALMAFAERFNPAMFFMDLDRGMEIFVRAVGGTYFSLEAGKPTGLNPFQLPDTPANRELMYTLVSICGADENGKLTASDEKQIQLAVNTVLSLDFENRNFSYLLQSIPIISDENSLRSRLAKWCRSENGRFAWCLDNPVNLFNPDDFYRVGIDLTDILKPDYPPTAPVLTYLFHLRQIMMKRIAEENGILATIIEEFWYAARYEVLQEIMLKMLKADRKLGAWLILVSQSPEDAINCPIFPAIIQQTPTKILLPNPDAEYKGSYERCGITEKEYDELMALSIESRTFLIKQSKQSAFAKLNLYGFENLMPFLSGSPDKVELLHKVMAKHGEHPDDWYAPFCEAVEKQNFERKRKKAEMLNM